MIHLFAFVLSLAGFAALAGATHRQQRDLFGRILAPSNTRIMRLAGMTVLLCALAMLVAQYGWGLGLVMFSGHTSFAAGVVVCGLIGYARMHGQKLKHR